MSSEGANEGVQRYTSVLLLIHRHFRFAGSGPGYQKTSRLAKKYLQGKGVSKRGRMGDLDFGVEVAEVRPTFLSLMFLYARAGASVIIISNF